MTLPPTGVIPVGMVVVVVSPAWDNNRRIEDGECSCWRTSRTLCRTTSSNACRTVWKVVRSQGAADGEAARDAAVPSDHSKSVVVATSFTATNNDVKVINAEEEEAEAEEACPAAPPHCSIFSTGRAPSKWRQSAKVSTKRGRS